MGDRLVVVCRLLIGCRLQMDVGFMVVLFLLLLMLGSKVVGSRVLLLGIILVVEFCLMLGSKVVVVLNKDKVEVVSLFRTVVEEMATRGGQARLSRAEVGETEIDGQGLLFQLENVAPGELEEVMVYMDGQD